MPCNMEEADESIFVFAGLEQKCRDFVKYGCKKGCTGRCKYLTPDLKCKELYKCINDKSC